MKRIVWVTSTYFTDVDRSIVPYLSKTFKIDWIILGNVKEYPSVYQELLSVSNSHQNINLEYYAIVSSWYTIRSYFDFSKFFEYIIRKDSEIIYIDSSLMFGAYHAAARILPKNKTVLATHNVKTPKGARLEIFARFYMNLLLHNFKNFQVFSKNQYDYLYSLVTDKNVLLAPLALKDYGKCDVGTRRPDIVNFLSFGHIRKYKRIDLLIDAAQLLYEETKKDFIVTIAGNCPEWDLYNERIRYPHLFNINIGYISDNEIPSLFSDAHYLVLPYQDLAQSGAITVAFNYDVPVITSDIPQFMEFVANGENGFTFKSEDVISLKNVLKQCLDMDGLLYEKLIDTTQKFVRENYSLSSICERYIEYFNKI